MTARPIKPTPLPVVQQAAQREWAAGWYTGLPVGLVLGIAVAVLLGWLR